MPDEELRQADKAEELAREIDRKYQEWAMGFDINIPRHMRVEGLAALLRPHLESERWIPVRERLPDDKQMVMGWFQDGMTNPIVVRYIGGREFHDFFKNWVAITHWRPLPAPPEEGMTR